MSADCCPDWLNFWKVSARACAHMLVQTPTHICNTVQVWCMQLPSLYCWTLADKTIPRSHLRPDPCWKELTERNPPWGVCGARWGCAVGPCPSCSVRCSRTEAASPIRSGNCTQWKHSSGRSSWWRGDRKQRRGWGAGGGVLTERMFCYGSFVPNAGPDTVCFFFREIQVKICLCVCVEEVSHKENLSTCCDQLSAVNLSSLLLLCTAFCFCTELEESAILWHLTDNIHSPQANLQAGQLERPRGLWSESEACGGASAQRGRGYTLQIQIWARARFPNTKTLHFRAKLWVFVRWPNKYKNYSVWWEKAQMCWPVGLTLSVGRTLQYRLRVNISNVWKPEPKANLKIFANSVESDLVAVGQKFWTFIHPFCWFHN